MVALGAAVAIPLLVRSRRRTAWSRDLAAATAEVEWFARVLLTQLQSAATPEQVVGGWSVGADRVTDVEDELTTLAASARSEVERARALSLRDAVRTAREHLSGLTAPAAPGPAPGELAAVAAQLEAALAQEQA